MRLNDREEILALTREWTGERFPNGRPRVSDDMVDGGTSIKAHDVFLGE